MEVRTRVVSACPETYSLHELLNIVLEARGHISGANQALVEVCGHISPRIILTLVFIWNLKA